LYADDAAAMWASLAPLSQVVPGSAILRQALVSGPGVRP